LRRLITCRSVRLVLVQKELNGYEYSKSRNQYRQHPALAAAGILLGISIFGQCDFPFRGGAESGDTPIPTLQCFLVLAAGRCGLFLLAPGQTLHGQTVGNATDGARPAMNP
jgi:hypothetical protein